MAGSHPSLEIPRVKFERSTGDDSETATDIASSSPPKLSNLPADLWDQTKLLVPTPMRAISLHMQEDVRP